MPMWALEEVDGVYQISSAADLKAFAELVNGGQNTVSAVLTADIVADADQPMIGLTSGTAFKGSFDGQGHTLTLNWTGDNALTSDPAGLFPYLAGNVSNLRLDGTIEAKGARSGALAGRVEAAVTISNIISNVTMIGLYAGDSALSGLVARPSTAGVVIQNCIYTGTMISDVSVNVGAIIGWNGAASTMVNCAFLGTIKIKDLRGNYNLTNVDSNVLGRFQNGPLTSSNCYYLPVDLSQEDLDAGYINVTGTLSGATAVTAEQITSGEVCFHLNGEGETVWYQTIGSDAYPVLDKTHGVVYLNGRQHCDGSPYEGTEFSNENKGFTKDSHDFVDGVCSACGTADPNFISIGEDGYYSISTAGQFAWFASKVNSGNADLNARLTAPIDMEGIAWTPIGTVAVPYTGTFDGQMYPITNISNMLFGTITGAQITGVALESGEITATNTADAPHTSSIVGHSTAASGSITNSYSKVAINGSNGEDLGGIAGKYLGTMKNVAFLGSFAGSLTSWSMGGLAGSTNSTNTTFISDCMVYCDWGDGLDPGYGARGGLVGWCHTNTVNSSYVVVNSTDHTGFTKLLGDGTGSLAQSEFKSLDQFASGEVAYLMNADQDQPAWFQTLGKDAYPVLDNTHKVVYFADGVYYNEKDETVPEADLLDVVFHEDGTAEDVSPMHSTVELCGTTSSTYYNQTYKRYTARFENPWGKTCTGYYKVDFESNEAIRSALADGHTLEMLVMGDYEGTIEDVEAKPFSAMQGGGTGFLICKTNSEGRQNEFTFLPNVTTTGNSTWRWTNSGVVPQAKTYYHVVGVWNKEESKAYIYVNGELCNTIDASGDFRFANAGCNWFCIGGDADPNGGGQGWTGDVAIARAYDKALTPEEAAALWNKLNDETGIGVISADALPSAPIGIFRLDGVRVDKAQHGVYIIDGKKKLVK